MPALHTQDQVSPLDVDIAQQMRSVIVERDAKFQANACRRRLSRIPVPRFESGGSDLELRAMLSELAFGEWTSTDVALTDHHHFSNRKRRQGGLPASSTFELPDEILSVVGRTDGAREGAQPGGLGRSGSHFFRSRPCVRDALRSLLSFPSG